MELDDQKNDAQKNDATFSRVYKKKWNNQKIDAQKNDASFSRVLKFDGQKMMQSLNIIIFLNIIDRLASIYYNFGVFSCNSQGTFQFWHIFI